MKNIYYLLTVLISAFGSTIQAQPLQMQWAHGIYSSQTSFSTLNVNVLETDVNGNTYVAGGFQGTVDLDPSAAVANITSNLQGFGWSENFIAKYNAAGEFVFGFALNVSISDIKILDNDEFYLIGQFDTIVDFDPSAAVNILDGTKDKVFAAKYNKDGQYVSSFSAGINNRQTTVQTVRLDSKNNLCLYGSFRDTTDFDPSVNVTNLNTTELSSFVVKYTDKNELVFAFKIEYISSNYGYNLVIDQLDQLYISGGFFPRSSSKKLDLDPGPGNTNFSGLGGIDGFLAKYSSTGSYIEGHLIDGNIRNMTLDKSNNVYIAGSVVDGMDVDLSAAEHKLYTDAGGFDQFLVKYNADFDLIYGMSFRGNSSEMRIEDMKVDNNENVYLCGEFEDTIGFIKGSAQGDVISKGARDVFFAKFDKAGQFKFAHSFGAESFDEAKTMSFDNNGNVWLAGEFNDSINLDPNGSSKTTVEQGNGRAMFLSKYLDPSAVSVIHIKKSDISFYINTGNLIIDFAKQDVKNVKITIMGINGQVYRTIENIRSYKMCIPLISLPQKQIFIVQVDNEGALLNKKLFIP